MLIFGLVAFGTRIGLLQALGTALTLVGVGAIAARGDLQVLRSFSFLIGDVFMLIACASYAVYTLALRDRPKVSGFVFFSVLALAALMISLPLLAWEIAAGEVIWPDLRGFAILLYVTLFPSLLSQIFFMRGVELIGPGRAGLFVNLVPVFGAILGVAILGEPFRWYHAVGLALARRDLARRAEERCHLKSFRQTSLLQHPIGRMPRLDLAVHADFAAGAWIPPNIVITVAVPQELPTVLAQNANDCRREIVHADTLGESTDMTVGLPGVWRVENSEGQALSFWNQAPF